LDGSGTFGDSWPFHPNVVDQGVEGIPGVTTALTATIQPFEEKPLGGSKEALEARRVPSHPVIVPVSAILGVEGGENSAGPLVPPLLDPVRKVGYRGPQLLTRSATLHEAASFAAFFPAKLEPKKIEPAAPG